MVARRPRDHPVRSAGDRAMTDKRERKPFTGRHAAMILIAFFGVVISINMVMASFALSTFGGTVVDNSYVASQHYNKRLERADAQDRPGWEQSHAVAERKSGGEGKRWRVRVSL